MLALPLWQYHFGCVLIIMLSYLGQCFILSIRLLIHCLGLAVAIGGTQILAGIFLPIRLMNPMLKEIFPAHKNFMSKLLQFYVIKYIWSMAKLVIFYNNLHALKRLEKLIFGWVWKYANSINQLFVFTIFSVEHNYVYGMYAWYKTRVVFNA